MKTNINERIQPIKQRLSQKESANIFMKKMNSIGDSNAKKKHTELKPVVSHMTSTYTTPLHMNLMKLMHFNSID